MRADGKGGGDAIWRPEDSLRGPSVGRREAKCSEMDGSGYPRGLAGDAICLEARIIGVADVVEAMASHRPYRPSLDMAR